MKLIIVTIAGSTTSLEDVDPSWTVLSLKSWVQLKDGVPPHQRHTPPFAYNADTQLHPDFDRLFCNGTELVEVDKTLQQYGVEDGSTMRFALPETKAADLRMRLYALLEQYPKDPEVANITKEDTCDDRILPFVLDMYLQRRLRKQEANARVLEAHCRGEPAAFPAKNRNLLRSDAIQKELLYKLFDPAVVPVRFQILSGGADGNTPYVGLIVEANKTSYKYKTFYGIPVTETHPNRIKQNARSLQAGPDTRNWAAQGFVNGNGKNGVHSSLGR